VLVDRADHGDHDRREEDEEAPEDRGVDEARDKTLEELALSEDDHGLVAGAGGDVAAALDGAAGADEVDEELRTTGKEEAARREGGGEDDRSGGDVYVCPPGRSRFSSAVIAGTISVRSPITA
jgi:hypothetical protein